MLRHENILGFIAADNKHSETCTQHFYGKKVKKSKILFDTIIAKKQK